jgi:type IV pilus assembly protein PilM
MASQSATPHKRDSFLEFFPTPRFLSMPAVGLSISDNAIRAIELIPSPTGFTVGTFAEKKLSSKAILAGSINDKGEILAALQALKKECKLRFVRVSIPEEKAFFFRASVPKVSLQEVHDMIELRLEENVPIAPSEAVFDYGIVHPPPHVNHHYDVSVSVLPRNVVESFTEVLKEADLVPLSLEIEPQALVQSVIVPNDPAMSMIIHFGETKTGIFVVGDGAVYFTSTVGIGGKDITVAIEKQLSVSPEEAQKIKENWGLNRGKEHVEIFSSLAGTLSALKDEISKISIYWQTHKDSTGEPGRKIEKIILCGRDAGLCGLEEYLGLSLKIPVIVGNPWVNVLSFDTTLPPIEFFDSLDYAAAIGLALPKE